MWKSNPSSNPAWLEPGFLDSRFASHSGRRRSEPQLLQAVGQVTRLSVRTGRPGEQALEGVRPSTVRFHGIGVAARIVEDAPVRSLHQVRRYRKRHNFRGGRIIFRKISEETPARHSHSTEIQNEESVAHVSALLRDPLLGSSSGADRHTGPTPRPGCSIGTMPVLLEFRSRGTVGGAVVWVGTAPAHR